MKSLPPLKSLHAFEAAGRHLSFTEAANELSVTPGAISQQIRLLEEFLETRLFKRLNRSIVLTDAGQLFLPAISAGFEQITTAVESVRSRSNEEMSLESLDLSRTCRTRARSGPATSCAL